MREDFIEMVYLTATSELLPEYCVPGVEDLFEQGKPCDRIMTEMYETLERLKDRLGVEEADDDLDTVVDSIFSVCAIVGRAMYHYGAKFGEQAPQPEDPRGQCSSGHLE